MDHKQNNCTTRVTTTPGHFSRSLLQDLNNGVIVIVVPHLEIQRIRFHHNCTYFQSFYHLFKDRNPIYCDTLKTFCDWHHVTLELVKKSITEFLSHLQRPNIWKHNISFRCTAKHSNTRGKISIKLTPYNFLFINSLWSKKDTKHKIWI